MNWKVEENVLGRGIFDAKIEPFGSALNQQPSTSRTRMTSGQSDSSLSKNLPVASADKENPTFFADTDFTLKSSPFQGLSDDGLQHIAAAQTETRKISNVPFKVLDAPSLVDDYYLNLVDWSAENNLAVCLSRNLYIWNAKT